MHKKPQVNYMETRNVTLTLKKAKEFCNSGNAALKEVALQAFTKEELSTPNYQDITTFEDAVKALGMDMSDVNYDLNHLDSLEGGLSKHLVAVYKLDIVRRALNIGWEPKLTEGDIYYTWVRFYLPNKVPSDAKVIGKFKSNGQKYLLVSGYGDCGYCDGLGHFNSGCGYSYSSAYLGLLCCKTREIAQHFSTYFGKLIFDTCYAQHIGLYEWL